MNTSALGVLLGAVAIAGVGVVYLKVDELSGEVRNLAGRSAKQRVVETGETADNDRIRAERRALPAKTKGTATEPSEVNAPVAETPGTIEERIERLEKAESRRGKVRADMPFSSVRMRAPVRSVDQLATKLKLSPTQKDRISDAVARGKRRIDDILKIPDESGKSPHQRRKEQREKLMEAIKNRDNSNVVAFASDMFSHRSKKIPGRNTTYGEEIKRVQDETRNEIAQSLNAEQKKQMQDTNIDPMLGGGHGAMTMSVWSGGDDSGEGEGGMVIGERMEVGVAIEEPEASEKSKAERDGDDDDG